MADTDFSQQKGDDWYEHSGDTLFSDIIHGLGMAIEPDESSKRNTVTAVSFQIAQTKTYQGLMSQNFRPRQIHKLAFSSSVTA